MRPGGVHGVAAAATTWRSPPDPPETFAEARQVHDGVWSSSGSAAGDGATQRACGVGRQGSESGPRPALSPPEGRPPASLLRSSASSPGVSADDGQGSAPGQRRHRRLGFIGKTPRLPQCTAIPLSGPSRAQIRVHLAPGPRKAQRVEQAEFALRTSGCSSAPTSRDRGRDPSDAHRDNPRLGVRHAISRQSVDDARACPRRAPAGAACFSAASPATRQLIERASWGASLLPSTTCTPATPAGAPWPGSGPAVCLINPVPHIIDLMRYLPGNETCAPH